MSCQPSLLNITNESFKNELNKSAVADPGLNLNIFVIGSDIKDGNRSTLKLVEKSKEELNEEEYDPFSFRQVQHPTTYGETLVNFLKSLVGTGVLAMPYGFQNTGMIIGILGTCIIGFISAYCGNTLVRCSHILLKRRKIPILDFAGVAEQAFLSGPQRFRKYSMFVGKFIDLFIVLGTIGGNGCYIVFIASNLKQLLDPMVGEHSSRIYMVAMLPVILVMNLVRNLKYIAPFSMFANAVLGSGLVIIFYYIVQDLPAVSTMPLYASASQLPLFFGTAVFAYGMIGVVLPLENDMKKPTQFLGVGGVLSIGVCFTAVLYTTMGFLGYLKYGEKTEASITLNLPLDEPIAKSVKLLYSVAVLFTYPMASYPAMQILQSYSAKSFKSLSVLYFFRVLMDVLTVLLAILIPNLGAFVSLVGAVSSCLFGLIFPPVIELLTYYEDFNYGRFYSRIWKNIFIIIFGALGFITGTYFSILDIINFDK
ncbi:proton-coupled amino acid transporter-like protein CG1139 isoform X1 [Nilaparvata lugens]|uniref:proton-coupled amino acid transporter-like protein CG1139 isoform X1 n=2 Tax=Nilaparvata lugens TaxID=108931 RepID=UPI00193CEF5F|nr:proton-coupled amino acid transporter-like protein CG1139 isoform X1 [Nilaparvata lugens]